MINTDNELYVYGRPDASPTQQVAFLQSLLHVKRQKIIDLEMEVDALKRYNDIDRDALTREVVRLQRQLRPLTQKRPVKKWWKFWSKNEPNQKRS